jgi:uncharacterized protein DUF1761
VPAGRATEGATVLIDLGSINYLAVLVAGAATFLLGGLWYTVLFGKLWQRLHGYSEEKLKELQAKMSPPLFFGGMIVCYLVLAFVVAVLITTFKVDSIYDGAVLGALLWLVAAAIGMTGHLASGKRFGIFLIDTSFQLIYLVMMGALLGAWR